MAIPQLRNEGVDQGGGSTAFTITFASFTWAAGDIIELVMATDGWVPVLTTANGFQLAQDPSGNTAAVTTNSGVAGPNECGIFVFWKRATGSTTTTDPPPVFQAPSVSGGTAWCLQPNSFSGARSSGTPYHAITNQVISSATTSITSVPVSSTLANCLFMPRVASANDDQTFASWTMNGSASPSGTKPVDTGWHQPAGNACAFVGDEGGFASPTANVTATSTFGAATKQALTTLVMASLPEVVNTGWLINLVDRPTRGALATAVLAGLVAPVLTIANPTPPSSTSWAPSLPDVIPRERQRAAPGGWVGPDATIPAPSTPVLSWAPSFPDQVLPRSAPRIIGGLALPDAVLPNAAAPLLSWAPGFSDSVPRARQPVNTGGITAPEATLPNPPAPALSWGSTFPDRIPHTRRSPNVGGLFAPVEVITNPSGAPSIGALAFRQKANVQLPTTGTLTTLAVYPAWTPNTTYTLVNAVRITNGGNCYELAQSGTSGTLGSGGPTGTGSAIVDGGCKWNFLAPGTGAVNTQAANSYFTVSIGRGLDSTSGTVPRDNKGGTYSLINKALYAGFPGSAAAAYKPSIPAAGGTGHTFSADWGAGQDGGGDEITMAAVEVINGAVLQDHAEAEVSPNGSNVCTSPSVTTTNAAVLVAFWWLNGTVQPDGFLHTAIAGSSFINQPLASGLMEIANGAGQVQMATATRVVDTPGTYSATITTANGEGAIVHLLAVQATSSPALPPLTWLSIFPDRVSRARRLINVDGTTKPEATLPDPPTLSWQSSPTLPTLTRTTRALTGGMVAPPTDTNAGPLTWLPSFPDRIPILRRAPLGGASTPPPDTNAGPLTWLSQVPSLVGSLRILSQGGEFAPPPVIAPPAPPLSWAPAFPDVIRQARRPVDARGMTKPEATIPNQPAPSLSWSPEFPDSAPRVRQPINTGGTFAPEATLPNPPAPPLSWAPAFPAFAPRALQSVNVGGMIGPEETIPNPPAPPLSWGPEFPDFTLRPSQPINTGGMIGPVAPNLVTPRTTPPGRATAQIVGHVTTQFVESRQSEDTHLHGTVRRKRDV